MRSALALKEKLSRRSACSLPRPKAASCELLAVSLNSFISSVFKGNVGSALKRIALDTCVNGAAINVVALLLTAEKLKGGSLGYAQFYSMLDANEEISSSALG